MKEKIFLSLKLEKNEKKIINSWWRICRLLCSSYVEKKNFDIHIIENSNMLGGGVRTFWYGGHPYTFGPRHFLTENEKWFSYLNDIIPMRDISKDHQNLTYVESDKSFLELSSKYERYRKND